ncbi:hypothetical protein AVEN_64674-1 [Araneus ventricosus]|uniref:Uncharacterized protein n=1 Tax=Araneus ventricosus TaxID=182803 RepID=A0A4Y2V3T7_ARAVE|nr:hypothetical protein AVEN_64674-1 [Araneus ventricosus]
MDSLVASLSRWLGGLGGLPRKARCMKASFTDGKSFRTRTDRWPNFSLKEKRDNQWRTVAVFCTGGRGARLVPRDSEVASKSTRHTSQC